MPQRTDTFDLARLRLSAGEGRRLELFVHPDALRLSDAPYPVAPDPLPVVLDVARMTGGGWSLRLRFSAQPTGACMRCLQPAAPRFDVDAREIDQPGEGEELDSPYVSDDQLVDLRSWARDALALALPAQILCREECAGLCAVCGADLNAEPGHAHEPEPDPRWAKLRELKLD
ncbi:MAG: hypothetical protein QOE65_218 [Solirubrobacteraceae bacterium]|jgi:uncharacterized protein|nr:hypothetical protein [Solirubrobacteraceae bacterium]